MKALTKKQIRILNDIKVELEGMIPRYITLVEDLNKLSSHFNHSSTPETIKYLFDSYSTTVDSIHNVVDFKISEDRKLTFHKGPNKKKEIISDLLTDLSKISANIGSKGFNDSFDHFADLKIIENSILEMIMIITSL